LSKEFDPTLSVINKAIENDFKDIDCLIIGSSQGNGGTHLLNATLQRIRNSNGQTKFISSELLGIEFEKHPSYLLNHLLKYQYIGIDDFQYFDTLFKPEFSQWFKGFTT